MSKADLMKSRLAAAQGNAWPAMVASLADDLNVTSEALLQIGVGWMPIVNFSKGPSYCGWWAIPERDGNGTVVGLSLRSRTGMKVMLPGSKHGLVYAVNPAFDANIHRHSEVGFIRTMLAGVDCPICGKPDGCLVSDDDPDNPRAAICIRVSEGAVQPREFGWLHHRKPHELHKGSPLLPSDDPVIVVEGMSDCAAAMSLGLVAVGRPSNLAGMSDLRTLLRGRPAIVIGENDKPDKFGRVAGVEGMQAAFENLRSVCSEVRQCLPPSDVKDLRGWVERYRLTRDELLAYVDQKEVEREEDAILPDSNTHTLRDHWLQTAHWLDGVPILRYQSGSWFKFNGSFYKEVEEKSYVRGSVHEALEGKQCQDVTKDGTINLVPINLTRSRVGDILDSSMRVCPVMEPAPVWINGVTDVPKPDDCAVFTNGVLDIATYLDSGEIRMLQPTPHLFTLNALPYDFDPDREVSALWLQWLHETLGDDPNKILLLQEWFGYNLVADMSMEKMMMFQGSPRSGKGTALEVLRALLGVDQVATTNFRSLADAFGRAPLVGKLALFLSDARGGNGDTGIQSVETILNVTGRDGINVNRKNMPELPHYYPTCRITMAVNDLPTLYDPSQALASRLLALKFAQSFEGRANPHYKTQLISEAPAIMLWALDGLKRLRQNRRFTTTESGEALVTAFRRVISPVLEFLEECCVNDPEAEVGVKALYDVWRGWTRDRGLRPWSRSKVKERIAATWPHVEYSKKDMAGDASVPVATGLRVQKWAEQTYIGRP